MSLERLSESDHNTFLWAVVSDELIKTVKLTCYIFMNILMPHRNLLQKIIYEQWKISDNVALTRAITKCDYNTFIYTALQEKRGHIFKSKNFTSLEGDREVKGLKCDGASEPNWIRLYVVINSLVSKMNQVHSSNLHPKLKRNGNKNLLNFKANGIKKMYP